ncbi:MAG: hypothetical protein M3429_06190 [Verrucomicrobiota bacterium]|jgi:hypothetical protein|nr:hypothetical protein [Chthoniobacterales bacterium]MDQ3117647.1 hypothetical protein [Verrucomicrobiota bacterium]MDQ3546091.1 hypothetical protein [Verrucomicrobiota bacterium]
MRPNDCRDGSIKALLILVLLVANIAVAVSHRRAEPPSSQVATSPAANSPNELSQPHR